MIKSNFLELKKNKKQKNELKNDSELEEKEEKRSNCGGGESKVERIK